MASKRCVAVLCVCVALIAEGASAAGPVISKGDLLFLSGNTLLATSPTGAKRASIQLASSKAGPLDVDGFPEDGKRPIEVVFPGVVSPDGRLSFNSANFNRPVNKNTSDDLAYLIVTDLAAGKVKQTVRVPLPGLPAGTNFNFQSDFFPPADQGDIETNLGYNARKYVAVGAPVNGEYPLFIVISAFSCKDRDEDSGEPNKQQLFTKYSYNADTGSLKWSGVSQVIVSACKVGKGLLNGKGAYRGRALGAVGSAGYLIAGNLRLGGPGQLAVYKLVGTKLKAIFKKPRSDTDDYFSKLTLVNGNAKSNTVTVAGVSDPYSSADSRSKIRLFGGAPTSSLLTGFRFRAYESVEALGNYDGGLFVLTVEAGPNNGPRSNKLTVVKIGPFSVDVAGGKDIPASIKRVFKLPVKYAGSLAVV